MVQWLEQLHDALRRRGLPNRYVQRFVEELSDHLTDVLQEASDMGTESCSAQFIEERIGRCDDLANAALQQLRDRTLCGRHPWLAMIIAPPVLLLGTLACYCVLLITATTLLDDAGSWKWFGGSFVAFCYGAAYVPAAIAAFLLCSWGIASGWGWHWYVPACAFLTVLAAPFGVSCQLPTSPGTGRLAVGFGLGTHVFQSLHGLVPLSIAAISFWRERRMKRSDRRTPQVLRAAA